MQVTLPAAAGCLVVDAAGLVLLGAAQVSLNAGAYTHPLLAQPDPFLRLKQRNVFMKSAYVKLKGG